MFIKKKKSSAKTASPPVTSTTIVGVLGKSELINRIALDFVTCFSRSCCSMLLKM